MLGTVWWYHCHTVCYISVLGPWILLQNICSCDWGFGTRHFGLLFRYSWTKQKILANYTVTHILSSIHTYWCSMLVPKIENPTIWVSWLSWGHFSDNRISTWKDKGMEKRQKKSNSPPPPLCSEEIVEPSDLWWVQQYCTLWKKYNPKWYL